MPCSSIARWVVVWYVQQMLQCAMLAAPLAHHWSHWFSNMQVSLISSASAFMMPSVSEWSQWWLKRLLTLPVVAFAILITLSPSGCTTSICSFYLLIRIIHIYKNVPHLFKYWGEWNVAPSINNFHAADSWELYYSNLWNTCQLYLTPFTAWFTHLFPHDQQRPCSLL